MQLTRVQEALLFLVKTEFTDGYNKSVKDIIPTDYTATEWDEIYSLASKHSLCGTIYPTARCCSNIPAAILANFKNDANRAVSSAIYLGSFAKIIMTKFDIAGIPSVIMKGPAISRYYPIPEYRKSGDSDIAVLPEDYEKACSILEQNGFELERATSLHGEYKKDGLKVELHRLMVEPLPEEDVNKQLVPIFSAGIKNHTTMTIDPKLSYAVFPDDINGLEILLHMLQHFIMGGFGVKLLCDWMVFIKHITDTSVTNSILTYLEQFGLRTFAGTCTWICKEYLGLSSEKAAPFLIDDISIDTANSLLTDALEAGEFQNKKPEYMVVLDDNSLGSLIKQFHYQMKHNHPKASKCVLLWPALWVITLVVFIWNNMFLRKVKTSDIIKGALHRAEGVSTGSLNLFKK